QSRQPACFHIERVDARANVQGRADPSGFGRDVERRWLAQPADPLAAFVAIQVRRPTALVLDLAIGRDLEPFLHPFVGFQFGHDRYVLFVLTVVSAEALASPSAAWAPSTRSRFEVWDNSLGPFPLGQLPSSGSAGRIKPTGRAHSSHTGKPGNRYRQTRAAV